MCREAGGQGSPCCGRDKEYKWRVSLGLAGAQCLPPLVVCLLSWHLWHRISESPREAWREMRALCTFLQCSLSLVTCYGPYPRITGPCSNVTTSEGVEEL